MGARRGRGAKTQRKGGGGWLTVPRGAHASHERDRSAGVPDQRLVDVVHAVGGHRRDRRRVDAREPAAGRSGPRRGRVQCAGPLPAAASAPAIVGRRRRRRLPPSRRVVVAVEMVDARTRHAQVPVATVLVLLGHARRPAPDRRAVVVVHGEPQLLRRLQAAAPAAERQ